MATYTRTADRDIWITDEFPTANWDSFGLRSGVVPGPYARRFLLHFDISDFPPDYLAIVSAQLEIAINADGILDVAAKIYRLTRTNWVEAAATWNKYNSANNWTTPGGDYDLTTPTPVQWFQPRNNIDVIIPCLEFVTDAIANRSSLVSIIARQNDEAAVAGQYTYHDKENGSGQAPPTLRIEYTRPAEATRVLDDPRVTIGAAPTARSDGPAAPSAPPRGERPARPG